MKGEGGKKTKRRKICQRSDPHYISDKVRMPSVIGAANCFHREPRGNNVPLNESLFDLLVEITFSCCTGRDMLFISSQL